MCLLIYYLYNKRENYTLLSFIIYSFVRSPKPVRPSKYPFPLTNVHINFYLVIFYSVFDLSFSYL